MTLDVEVVLVAYITISPSLPFLLPADLISESDIRNGVCFSCVNRLYSATQIKVSTFLSICTDSILYLMACHCLMCLSTQLYQLYLH